ncbi:hypothetical protein J7363_04645 [Phaeobacter italicus]|nr:hypothetical protein [Phaeobacter italicus]MBO9441369.1 hypothetical protein [Phaeobacter italicus]
MDLALWLMEVEGGHEAPDTLYHPDTLKQNHPPAMMAISVTRIGRQFLVAAVGVLAIPVPQRQAAALKLGGMVGPGALMPGLQPMTAMQKAVVGEDQPTMAAAATVAMDIAS